MTPSLRFILAYLDDILEPAQAAEIGRQIKENPAAIELLERMSSVLRRRRLLGPEVLETTAGQDANDLAEYIDNLTPKDQIGAYESQIINSDEQLAEVTACHQILTLVLHGSVSVPSGTKDKLHALANQLTGVNQEAGDEKSGLYVKGKSSADMAAVQSVTKTPVKKKDESPPQLDLPPDKTGWKIGFTVALLLLCVVWVGSLIVDPSFSYFLGDSPVSDAVAQVDQPEPENEANTEVAAVDKSATEVSDDVTKTNTEVSQVGSNGGGDAPTENQDSVAKSSGPVEPNPDNAVAMNNNAAKPNETAVVNNPGPEKVVEKPVLPEVFCVTPNLIYTTADQPLVYDPFDQAQAVKAKPSAKMEAGCFVMTPRYCIADFVLVDDELIPDELSEQIMLHLRDSTVVTYLGADSTTCFGFRITRGQVVLDFPETELDMPRRFRVEIDGKIWRFDVPQERVQFAFSVEPQKPNQFETLPPQGNTIADCWASAPNVIVDTPITKKGEKPPTIEGYFSLLPLPVTADESEEVAEVGNDDSESEEPKNEQPIPAIVDVQTESKPVPEWVNKEQVNTTVYQQRELRDYMRLVGDSSNLWLDFEGVAKDPNPRVAQLGAHGLAMPLKYPALVSILASSPHEETRQEAIDGLRVWLVKNISNTEPLKAELAKHFNPETADTVYRLLWGFDEADGKNEVTSQELVGWLGDNHVAVRELAIYWIFELTGTKQNYRPLAPRQTIDQGVLVWERHLDRFGTLVKQE